MLLPLLYGKIEDSCVFPSVITRMDFCIIIIVAGSDAWKYRHFDLVLNLYRIWRLIKHHPTDGELIFHNFMLNAVLMSKLMGGVLREASSLPRMWTLSILLWLEEWRLCIFSKQWRTLSENNGKCDYKPT